MTLYQKRHREMGLCLFCSYKAVWIKGKQTARCKKHREYNRQYLKTYFKLYGR
jgi:hypothetical protein